MNKKTLVVNLIGAPSTGKSTIAAEVFALLKWKGVDCELVTEFAKDIVWDERYDDMKDEIYLFAKQNHRLFRVNGKVDVIITDHPLILSVMYNDRYGTGGEELNQLIMKEFSKYNNFTALLYRVHEYNPIGRVQTEDEANEIAKSIKTFLNKNKVEYKEYPGDIKSSQLIVEEIVQKLQEL